jgi:hypothetical protein
LVLLLLVFAALITLTSGANTAVPMLQRSWCVSLPQELVTKLGWQLISTAATAEVLAGAGWDWLIALNDTATEMCCSCHAGVNMLQHWYHTSAATMIVAYRQRQCCEDSELCCLSLAHALVRTAASFSCTTGY